jgi:hypothetical protein
MVSWNCKQVQHVKIYLPCNFEVNPIAHFGVISLFSSNFQNFNTFRPLQWDLLQNCRVGRSWYAAHFCNFKLTFISYSFWNIRQKVLKFYKFRRQHFQKSSPLKVLDQWKPNLVWIITRVFSFKIVSGDAVHQPTSKNMSYPDVTVTKGKRTFSCLWLQLQKMYMFSTFMMFQV